MNVCTVVAFQVVIRVYLKSVVFTVFLTR